MFTSAMLCFYINYIDYINVPLPYNLKKYQIVFIRRDDMDFCVHLLLCVIRFVCC